MTHGIHPTERPPDGHRIPHVCCGIFFDVEHHGLVPALPEGSDDMGPDEPGTAGDQYTHTATLAPRGWRTGVRRRYVMTP